MWIKDEVEVRSSNGKLGIGRNEERKREGKCVFFVMGL